MSTPSPPMRARLQKTPAWPLPTLLRTLLRPRLQTPLLLHPRLQTPLLLHPRLLTRLQRRPPRNPRRSPQHLQPQHQHPRQESPPLRQLLMPPRPRILEQPLLLPTTRRPQPYQARQTRPATTAITAATTMTQQPPPVVVFLLYR